MIRAGLWQKQKRPSVCLLCRSRQALTGSSLKTYTNWAENAAQSPNADASSRPTPPTPNAPGFGQSTSAGSGFYGVSSGGTSSSPGWGVLGSTGKPSSQSPKPSWRAPAFARPAPAPTPPPHLSQLPTENDGNTKTAREWETRSGVPLAQEGDLAEAVQNMRRKVSNLQRSSGSNPNSSGDVSNAWAQLARRTSNKQGRSSGDGALDGLSDFLKAPRASENGRNTSKFWGEAKIRYMDAKNGDPETQRGALRRTSQRNSQGAPSGQRRPSTSRLPFEDFKSSAGQIGAMGKLGSASRNDSATLHANEPRKSGGGDKLAQLERLAVQPKKKAGQPKQGAANSAWDWVDEYQASKPKESGLTKEVEEAQAKIARESAQQREEWARRKERGRRDRGELREAPKKSQQKAPRRGRDEDADEDGEWEERRRLRRERKAEKERARLQALEEAGPTPILLPELINVAHLGTALGIKLDVFLAQLEELGFENISKESILTGETAALVAQEYGFEPTVDSGEEVDLKPRPPPEDPTSVPLRPPVVTIMGHVDHGKTTLLDYLRKSSIVSQEHGGITQHIGAFSVTLSSGKPITFLDTPGHAAFLTMRQRGANVTDIVILVVAADDSVKPQTLEALKHARAANVPIIVAINKVDKESANVERVKSDLAAHGVEIEDYGGDVQVVCVSGKTGQGMQDLEENVLLLSEMLDIRAEPDGMAEGWVLESSVKPIGRVATVLVKRGTLRPGDFIVAGTALAKVRVLRNEAGVEVKEAPPGTAVEILGWREQPNAGDQVLQAPDEDTAKTAIDYRVEIKERHESVAQQTQMDQERRERAALEATIEEQAEEEKEGGIKYVNFTVKGDVHGSVEAVSAAILEIGNNEARSRVLQSAPGQITEWDVEHAAVAGGCIINFNNTIPGHIKGMAEKAGVKILDHNIIYHLVEEVRDIVSAALPPVISTRVVAEADILQVFPINIKGRAFKNIAGCKVKNGTVMKKSRVRVLRGGEQIFEGNIDVLKHGKRDMTEIKKGSECGIMFDSDWDGFQQGDQIQTIEEVKEKRRL
ncbi:hypothetical protein OQA88_8507 [Cercophora sp. LCS_1]